MELAPGVSVSARALAAALEFDRFGEAADRSDPAFQFLLLVQEGAVRRQLIRLLVGLASCREADSQRLIELRAGETDGRIRRKAQPAATAADAAPTSTATRKAACGGACPDPDRRYAADCGGNVTSSRLRAVVLAIAASLLAGCATERSDGAPCPPVVAYSREFLARAADELDSLPAGSAIEQMLADYQVMRDQARACERFGE